MSGEAGGGHRYPDDASEDMPRKFGMCEYCMKETTVYAYALWVCAACLASDPAAAQP